MLQSLFHIACNINLYLHKKENPLENDISIRAADYLCHTYSIEMRSLVVDSRMISSVGSFTRLISECGSAIFSTSSSQAR